MILLNTIISESKFGYVNGLKKISLEIHVLVTTANSISP